MLPAVTLALMVVTVETGRIVSKLEAADRVLPRLPAGERDVLAAARAVHAGDLRELPDDLPGLDDLADRMEAAVRTSR